LEKKAVAQTARIGGLESEVIRQKNSLRTMVSKADSDDQLVSALKKEIERLRTQVHEMTVSAKQHSSPPRIVKVKNALNSANSASEVEVMRLTRLVKQQEQVLATQEGLIKELRGELAATQMY
jgi:hypothetical protein